MFQLIHTACTCGARCSFVISTSTSPTVLSSQHNPTMSARKRKPLAGTGLVGHWTCRSGHTCQRPMAQPHDNVALDIVDGYICSHLWAPALRVVQKVLTPKLQFSQIHIVAKIEFLRTRTFLLQKIFSLQKKQSTVADLVRDAVGLLCQNLRTSNT